MSILNEHQRQASLMSIDEKSRCCFTFLYHARNKHPRKWFGGEKMRKVLMSVALCLLMSGVFSTDGGASSTTHLVGYITDTDTGYPAEYTEVTFKNLRTSEEANVTTNGTGYYDFDLDLFEDWEDGDCVMIIPASSGTNTAYPLVVMVEMGSTKQSDAGRDSNENRYISVAQSTWIDSRNRIANDGNVQNLLTDNKVIDLPVGYNTFIKVWDGYSFYENGKGLPSSGPTYYVTLTFYFRIWSMEPVYNEISHTSTTIQYSVHSGMTPFWYDPALSICIDGTYDYSPLQIDGILYYDLSDSQHNSLDAWYAMGIIQYVRFNWR